MSDQPKTTWPILSCDDALAQIEFLKSAFGFTEAIVVRNPDDEKLVEHCQLRFPEGGGIMLGTANREGNDFSMRPTGAASIYVVTDHPDELLERALAAGAELFEPIKDEEYGSRGFSVTDPEGNIFSFGTYRGEA